MQIVAVLSLYTRKMTARRKQQCKKKKDILIKRKLKFEVMQKSLIFNDMDKKKFLTFNEWNRPFNIPRYSRNPMTCGMPAINTCKFSDLGNPRRCLCLIKANNWHFIKQQKMGSEWFPTVFLYFVTRLYVTSIQCSFYFKVYKGVDVDILVTY